MIHQQQHRPGLYVHHRLGPKYFIQLSLLHPWLLHCGQCTATAELGVLLPTSSMHPPSASRSRSPTRVEQLVSARAQDLQDLTRRVDALDVQLRELVDLDRIAHGVVDTLDRIDSRLEPLERSVHTAVQELDLQSRRILSRISLLEAEMRTIRMQDESLRRLRARLHFSSEAGRPQTPAGPPPATPARPPSPKPAGPPSPKPAGPPS